MELSLNKILNSVTSVTRCNTVTKCNTVTQCHAVSHNYSVTPRGFVTLTRGDFSLHIYISILKTLYLFFLIFVVTVTVEALLQDVTLVTGCYSLLHVMGGYAVILEPFKGNKSRYVCPSCNKRFEFARYVNQETGEYINDNVGRCNRELNCGYHYTPKQYYEDNKGYKDLPLQTVPYKSTSRVIEIIKSVDYLPIEPFEKSLNFYARNHFYSFLTSLFGNVVAQELIDTYLVGTSKHWPGANVFWQVDINYKIRQAKIMLYDPTTGRRVKTEGDKVYFAGKAIIKNYEANLQQCFFGELLLSKFPEKTIGIVESEKTAMIASVYFPDLIWLATGGSHGCKWTEKNVCQVLQGRHIILFPDLGFYEKWNIKAEAVMKHVNCKIAVSDLLEREATEDQKIAGWDLADYLLLNRDHLGWAMTTEGYPLFWDIKIPT